MTAPRSRSGMDHDSGPISMVETASSISYPSPSGTMAMPLAPDTALTKWDPWRRTFTT